MRKLIMCVIFVVLCGTLFAADGRIYWLPEVKIDGDFSEWSGLETMNTANAVYGGDHDPDDSEGAFILATDGDNLFIHVVVTDDNVNLNKFHNSLAWKGDSVEIYFGTLTGFRDDYEEGDVQLRIVPRSADDPFKQDFYISYDYTGGGTPAFGAVAARIEDPGYKIEATVALEDIFNPSLNVGMLTRCEFQVNDADDIERDRLLRWSSRLDDYYTPENWGRCPVVQP